MITEQRIRYSSAWVSEDAARRILLYFLDRQGAVKNAGRPSKSYFLVNLDLGS
jgi:hypothetical protein